MGDRGQTFRTRPLAAYAWSVLAFNILIILWGALVRATGSGAGYGEYWPLCRGVLIPHRAQVATLIEFTHRATSGVAVVSVLGLAFLGFRRFGSGHPVRRYAAAAVFFTLAEGLIGAALVLSGQVGNNTSMTRVFILALHLVNTFLLLASLALTATSVSATAPIQREGTATPDHPSAHAIGLCTWYGVGSLGVLAVAVSGTIAALGDTLFPTTSLLQGLHWDFSGSPNTLLRLRVIHPVIAVFIGVFLVLLALRTLSSETSAAARCLAKCLLVLTFFQFALGLLNVLLLTPLLSQILHLLTADLMWLTLVLLSAEMLGHSRHAAMAQMSKGL